MMTNFIADNMIDNNTLLDMLDDATAKQYKAFLKHQPMIQTMVDSGVFNVRNGQVIMNFNDLGKLMQVSIQISAYNNGRLNGYSPPSP